MTQARGTVVALEEVGVYHCISRCVRRAFLCGSDAYSGQNYEHRREWVRERIEFLSGVFGLEVFAYTVMSNHLHLVLRSRPDRVSEWSAVEVAERWCRLYPGKRAREEGLAYDEVKLKRILADPALVETYRERLKDLSWFMRCLNEPLARRANCEDGCSGRFWEGRFKCQRLMDAGAMLACMAYVDLNPVRAGLADELADSHFTSVYDRLMARRAEERLDTLGEDTNPTPVQKQYIDREKAAREAVGWLFDFSSPESPFAGVDTAYYLSLVDWTGRSLREDKPGCIPVELEDVLERFDLDAKSWSKNVAAYGSLFHRIAGGLEQLLSYARRRGQSWFRGHRGSRQLYAAVRS